MKPSKKHFFFWQIFSDIAKEQLSQLLSTTKFKVRWKQKIALIDSENLHCSKVLKIIEI